MDPPTSRRTCTVDVSVLWIMLSQLCSHTLEESLCISNIFASQSQTFKVDVIELRDTLQTHERHFYQDSPLSEHCGLIKLHQLTNIADVS